LAVKWCLRVNFRITNLHASFAVARLISAAHLTSSVRPSNGTSDADVTHFTKTIKPVVQMRRPPIDLACPTDLHRRRRAFPLHSIIKDHISPSMTAARRLGLILRKAKTATMSTPMIRNWSTCGCPVLAPEDSDDMVPWHRPKNRTKLERRKSNIRTTDVSAFVDLLTLYGRIKTAEQRTTIQQCGDWYTGHWWVDCYIWYNEEEPGRAAAPPSPLLDVCNSPPINGQSTNFISFNVALSMHSKGLKEVDGNIIVQ